MSQTQIVLIVVFVLFAWGMVRIASGGAGSKSTRRYK